MKKETRKITYICGYAKGRALKGILALILLCGFGLSAVFAKTVKVGIVNNPSMVLVDKQGQVAGIFSDILYSISEKEGWKSEYVYGRSDEVLDHLNSGNLDLLARCERWIYLLSGLVSLILLTIILRQIYIYRKKKRAARGAENLNQAVEEKTEELSFALQKAQIEEMIRSSYLATSVHELRNQLNNVIGFSGILLQQSSGEINLHQEKMILRIKESARYILDMLNDLHDAYRLDSDMLSLRPEEFELNSLLDYVRDSFLQEVQEKNLELITDFFVGEYKLISDKGRLEQILNNLLNNAIKFTDEGYVKLGCEADDKWIRICVEDSGVGVCEKVQDRLFRPFIQCHPERKTRPEGTGLGLFISLRLAKALGGDISVESEAGKGSKFCLILPRHGADTQG